MREIKCYQCEICNKFYRHEKKAQQCESKGKEMPLAKVGDILIYKHSISGFECEDEIKISKIIDKGHYLIYKFMSRLNNGWEKGLYFNDEICGNDEFKRRIKVMEEN